MKRSSFALAACVAMASALSVVAMVAEAVAKPFVLAYHYAVDQMARACAIAAPRNEVRQTKPSWVVKARAFAASLMRRERPVMTDSWRMCPSV